MDVAAHGEEAHARLTAWSVPVALGARAQQPVVPLPSRLSRFAKRTIACRAADGLLPRITAKGQVTIPQEIREELGLLPNTEVTFDIVDGEALLKNCDAMTKETGRVTSDWRVPAIRSTDFNMASVSEAV
jgi:AbrB family looped-hinge helix DNA binding protein